MDPHDRDACRCARASLQRIQDRFDSRSIRRTLADVPVANRAASRHDERRRKRDLPLGIGDAPLFDDAALAVRINGKRQTELLPELLTLRWRVNADRVHLGTEGVDLLQTRLQLTELLSTVGSPVAPVKHEDGVFRSPGATEIDFGSSQRLDDAAACRAKRACRTVRGGSSRRRVPFARPKYERANREPRPGVESQTRRHERVRDCGTEGQLQEAP